MTKQEAWHELNLFVNLKSAPLISELKEALDALKPPPPDLPECDLRAAWLKIVELERREAILIDRMDYLEGLMQEHSHQRIKDADSRVNLHET